LRKVTAKKLPQRDREIEKESVIIDWPAAAKKIERKNE
jgi:hypothetical protein